MPLVLFTRKRLGIALAVAAIAAGGLGVALASDHQDSPNVELNPLQDLTDVYAFPSPTAGRIVLVMNTRAFLRTESGCLSALPVTARISSCTTLRRTA